MFLLFRRLEEEAIQRKNEGIVKIPRAISTELKLHELRSETYNGMIRLLKPGCRTIVLLLDNQWKDKLIPKFHKAVSKLNTCRPKEIY
jgi:DnaJ family protein C protein 16